MSTHIERVGQANRGSPAAASSDTSSVERGPHNRGFRNRNPYPGRPQPSSSSTVPPVDLNATQATFLAGAAVHQAHQASMVAEHASNAALHFQQQAQVTQQNAVRQQAQFHQAATAIQSRAEAYVRQAQEEARSAGVERDEVARQASQTVEGFRREAVAEVQATQSQLEARANQWLNENMSQIMEQMESRDARLRSQEDALRGRDEEITRLQRELESVRREALDRDQFHARQREDLNRAHQEHLQQVALRHHEGLQSPVDVPLPITPRSNQTITTQVQAFEPPLPAPAASPGETFVNTPTSGMSFDLFGEKAEREARPAQPGTHTDVVAVLPAEPMGQPVALVPPHGLQHPPGLAPVVQPPPQRGIGVPFVPNQPVPPITNPSPRTRESFEDWVRGELRHMVSAEVGILAHRMESAGMIPPRPIASPPVAPQAQSFGAAQGAPVAQPAVGGTYNSAASCALAPNTTLGGGYVTPTAQNLPLSFQIQSAAHQVSGSSESSSESGDDQHGPKLPIPSRQQCRVCGDFHEEVSCPQLTMNVNSKTTTSGAGSERDFAQEEEDTIRVKSLNDLTLPNAPENAAQARGYVNQVLMAIGKLQKTPGNEVYQWAQECLTSEDITLKTDPRFPRTDREIASKLLKTCKKGRFGLIFQQMVESERALSGGMPNGRVMLRYIFRYFQLERDRIGMLGERNLLSLKMPGNSVQDLENFRDKYIYVMSTIPNEDLPREQTLFNHLIDELEKNSLIASKVQKSREAPLSSHRRTTRWLWEKLELLVQLDQQKKNRADFDRQLKLKPAQGYAGEDKVPANPGPKQPDKSPKKERPKKEKKEKDKKADKPKAKEAPAVPGQPGAKAKPKAKPKPKHPPPRSGDTTPRGTEAKRAANMTAAEKAKTPCMFYAYNSCKAKQCAFLHSDTQKYKGPPPKAMGKPKAKATVAASVALPMSSEQPESVHVHAMPILPNNKVSWLWDTAAGRHLIGKQALSHDMRKHLRESPNPVAFATGGGSQPGQQSIAFDGSKLLEGDEVYVLNNCPPAQSIGKTVIDKGYMFIWDPRESVPYLVAPENILRCRMKIPRNARICASRVVEYVPQYDEDIKSKPFVPGEHLTPVSTTALPAAESGGSELPDAEPEGTDEFAYSPSLGPDEPILEDVEEHKSAVEVEEKKPDGAAPGAPPRPPHPLDDKLLVDFGEGLPFREDVLKKEAVSEEHKRTHFPKNPFCPICHIAKDTSMRVAHKPDGKSDDFVDPPKQPFEQLATDDVILAKGDDHLGIGIGGIKTHHVVRDLFSGARMAYPLSKRDIQSHSKNFRHFVGLKAGELAPRTFIKMDEAEELEQAAHEVGFTPETSLPNRWPHNALLERDIREEKECCRSVHLQSGLPYEYHTYSFPYACLSMSFDRPALADSTKTQWEALTKTKFDGKRLCFGQLVYYRRKHPTKRTLEPNMAPGLFVGWRIDPGLRYRDVVKVLDYQTFRTKGAATAIDVPEAELYIESGDPVFPVANARDKALKGGLDGEKFEIPEIALQEVPFPPEGGIAAPSTPGAKSRRVYITVDRILKFKETPGCKGCLGKTRIHTAECIKRFTELVQSEKDEAEVKRLALEAVEAADGAAPSAPVPSAAEDDIDAFLKEFEDEVPATKVSGVATVPSSPVSVSDLCKESLPSFGLPPIPACASVPDPPEVSQPRGPNRRQRRNALRRLRPGPKSTMFEFACSFDSQMGKTNADLDINHVRLCKEMVDLLDPSVVEQLEYQIREAAKVAPPYLWASIPCTSGSPWQHLNAHKGGKAFKKRLAQQLYKSRQLFKVFVKIANLVRTLGGDVSFEWPQNSTGWNRDDVKAFFDARNEDYHEAKFHGCSVGLKSRRGDPIKKPWKVMTTNARLAQALSQHQCTHSPEEHQKCEGSETTRSAMYPAYMCHTIASALYPSKVVNQPVPSMPCVPSSEETQEHREVEQHLKHISPLSGFDELAVAVESDPTAHAMVCELLDHEKLLSEALGLESSTNPSDEVIAMVTKLLSRSEMLSDPRALEAIKAEADGLVKAGTWDLGSVREKDDVRAEAKKSGVSVHFGQLMTIASIKFYELAQHLQKMKGRIVYRGDCAKDEHGVAAVYQELGANPTSVQGLNACLAYGSIPGNAATAADAVKAYVQALLSSKYKTWIELPPELRPTWWKNKFTRPVVLLIKALYGHPDAGGLWERHLKTIIKSLGGEEVPEYPGNFWFPDTKLLLSTYVDDLTLSGPAEAHDKFWKQLTSQVDVEPPEPIYRILGRNHVVTKLPDSPGSSHCAALGAQEKALVLDMHDYAHQTVDLYKSITGVTTLKQAATPFCPDGSITDADDGARGELAPNACKILMKALWLGRLARPDIVKPINDLATKVQAWSKADDKKLLRLIQYINSTPHYRLAGVINDPPEKLELYLYVDADFAGDKAHAKSTSGGFLVLKGPSTHFPLAWVSKRQTSTSRSTTESEVVSLAHSLYSEGIPALQLWDRLLDKPVHLRTLEDNQATIIVVKKGYSPKLRHITRTHKVNLSSLSEIYTEDNASIEYVDTNEQAADIFTKALPPQKWANALELLGMRTDLFGELAKPK